MFQRWNSAPMICNVAWLSSATSTRSRRSASVGSAGAVGRLPDAQPHQKGELAADIGQAFDLDPAVHLLDDLARDRQPEAGAVQPPRGRAVGLGERGEQPRRLLGRHADAIVADGAADRGAPVLDPVQADADGEGKPRALNLIALPSRFRITWFSRISSPSSSDGTASSTCISMRRFLARMLSGDQLDLSGQRGAQVEGARFQRQLVHLDLGKSRMSLISRNSETPAPLILPI